MLNVDGMYLLIITKQYQAHVQNWPVYVYSATNAKQ